MKENIILLLTFCSSIVASCHQEQAQNDIDKGPFQAILDETMKPYQAAMKGKEIGMGLYIKGDELDLYVSSGLPEAYQQNIHFRGAGTTKTFTAAAILKLQEQGRLNIDDPVVANIPGTNEPYLPNTASYEIPFKESITIRQLLNHRAGVFDVSNTPILSNVKAPYAGENYIAYLKGLRGQTHTFTFDEMIAVVAKHKLSYFKPDAAYHYSSTGYNLLAVIIERISGKPLHQYLQDEFLHPLAMKNTYFPHNGSDMQLPKPSVTSWLKIDGKIHPITSDNASSAMSAGNIITTPKDLSTWAYHLFAAKKVLKEQSLKEMASGISGKEEELSYGLAARSAYVTIMRYHPGTNKTYMLFSTFFNYDDFQKQAHDMDQVIKKAIEEVEKNAL